MRLDQLTNYHTEGQTTIAIDIDIAGAYQASSRMASAWDGTGIGYLVPSTFPAFAGVTMAKTKVVVPMTVMAAAPRLLGPRQNRAAASSPHIVADDGCHREK
jgi:hypothetical protein